MLVFINVYLVCKFPEIFFQKVMIILWLFIGYQPQFPQKIVNNQKKNFTILAFINVDLVCKKSRKNINF